MNLRKFLGKISRNFETSFSCTVVFTKLARISFQSIIRQALTYIRELTDSLRGS